MRVLPTKILIVMTTAQQLINQGIKEGINQVINQGIVQGMEINAIMTIKKGLQLGLNTETIAILVDEPVQKVEEIIYKIKSSLL